VRTKADEGKAYDEVAKLALECDPNNKKARAVLQATKLLTDDGVLCERVVAAACVKCANAPPE
jgi:hypothetical protein